MDERGSLLPGTDPPVATPARDHVLYVCTGCNHTKSGEERIGVRSGKRLWDALIAEVARRGGSAVHVAPVACLSVCKDTCAAALTAPGKYTYVFGWLDPLTSAADLLSCAELYAGAEGGHVPRAERPTATRRLISRVPSPGRDPDVDDDPRNPRSAAQVPKPPRPW